MLRCVAARLSSAMTTEADTTNNKRSFVSRLPLFGSKSKDEKPALSDEDVGKVSSIPKWSFGVLNDRETVEVPGKSQSLPLAVLDHT